MATNSAENEAIRLLDELVCQAVPRPRAIVSQSMDTVAGRGENEGVRISEAPPDADSRRRAGHYEILGETYAKLEFFEHGWNPYARFLDVDKVDFILRRRETHRPVYREVQVKYGKLFHCTLKWELPLFDITSWRFFREDEFDAFLEHSDFFVAYVLAEDSGYQGDIFIFPVRDFASLLRVAIPSGDKRKVYISRLKDRPEKWVLRKLSKFSTVDDSSTVDVSRYRRNFCALLSERA